MKIQENAAEESEISIIVESKPKRVTVFREVYPIEEPYAYAAIVKDPETQRILYEVIEPTLKEDEEKHLKEIKNLLMEELDISLRDIENREKAKEYLRLKTSEVIKKYRMKVPRESFDKLLYYIIRDFLGYGKIDPLMKDPNIEDISIDGVNVPVYVWHRFYESMPTNIVFKTENELNSFIIRLAYLAGKNISVASPILDASLPDGSRVQLTYGSEVTRRGSTVTIRRFKADPLTISDLIAFNTVSSEMAAYLWYIIEHKASLMVAGGIACGKTTMLNCLSMFIKPEMKIVSVEDTPELNLPHENWVPSVVRVTFGGEGNITLYDLLKAAVRQRPDYIIVGEVRGEEAYTLFQAIATGHLGMCTIHAESVEAVINRLVSEPMNIPKTLIAMMNVIMVMTRTEIAGKPARRVSTITEIAGINPKSKEIITQEVFRWRPRDDQFEYLGGSSILERNMKKMGLSKDDVQRELQRRKIILEWMVKRGVRKHADVARIIREYYANPDRLFQKARMDLK
ncbi:MAG: type II/IV secretion system ATPase subunit [Candidatus Bathyarchaeia archaeon]